MNTGSPRTRAWRVLLVSECLPDPHPGGLARHVLDLADALHRRGCQVDLLGNARVPLDAHPEQRGPGRFIAALAGDDRGWKQQALGCFHAPHTGLTVRGLRAAIRAHAPGYDVVHYHGHLPWVAQGLGDLPFTQTRHDASGDCPLKVRVPRGGVDRCLSFDPADCASCATREPRAWQASVTRHAVRDLRRRTAQALAERPAIFVSEHLRRRTADALAPWGPRWQSEVIAHAVPRAALQQALPEPSSAGRTPRDPLELFSAGAMLAYKGFGPLLDALAAKRGPWRLTLAGDGPERAALEARHGSPAVRFLGWLPRVQVLQRMATADAVLLPSLCEESCPGVVLEALALGRVVYALHRGGTPELARHAGPGGERLRLFDSLAGLVDALQHPVPEALDPATALDAFHGDTEAMADAVLDHYARCVRPQERR